MMVMKKKGDTNDRKLSLLFVLTYYAA
jgi:hypothetical protein